MCNHILTTKHLVSHDLQIISCLSYETNFVNTKLQMFCLSANWLRNIGCSWRREPDEHIYVWELSVPESDQLYGSLFNSSLSLRVWVSCRIITIWKSCPSIQEIKWWSFACLLFTTFIVLWIEEWRPAAAAAVFSSPGHTSVMKLGFSCLCQVWNCIQGLIFPFQFYFTSWENLFCDTSPTLLFLRAPEVKKIK